MRGINELWCGRYGRAGADPALGFVMALCLFSSLTISAEKSPGPAAATQAPPAAQSAQTPLTPESPKAPATTSVPASPTPASPKAPPTLEETRLTMDKWIETQQIISKDRKDWQQGKEILQSRLELIKKEIATLKDKTAQAEASVTESDKKRNDLLVENEQLKTALAQLTEAVAAMETEVRKLFRRAPEPIQTKLQTLYQRIPEDPTKARVSVAERFQNVIPILDALNKANNEITVSLEVHNLADGKPCEVTALYVGLTQAYYVSARGEAGIGRPTVDGWKWEPSQAVAREVLTALEILQGKHSPAFVPLPVKLQPKP